MDPYLNTVLSIPCVLVLAWLSHRFIAKPALVLKSRLEKAITFPVYIRRIGGVVHKKILGFFDQVMNIKWKTFWIVLLVVSSLIWYIGSYLPSEVDFSATGMVPERILAKGWYAQHEGEGFRFVADEVHTLLKKPKSNSKLVIQGFMPGSFTDVNSMTVSCNGIACDKPFVLTAGEGFEYQVECSQIQEGAECDVRVEFNTVHQWAEGELDQRELSACITRIGFD